MSDARALASRALILAVALCATLASCTERALPPVIELQERSQVDPSILEVVDQHLRRVRAEPGSAARHAELATVYEANDFWEVARQCWGSALALEPDRPEWIYHQSTCARQAGDTQLALSLLRRSVELDPESAAARNDLGVAWMEEGETDKAATEFEAAMKLAPGHPTPMVGLAEVRVREGGNQEAAELCQRALALAGDYKHAHYILGLALRGLGRSDEARDELNKGLNAKRIGIQDEIAKRAQELKTSYTSRLAQASDLEARGDSAGAARILEQVVAARPSDVTALNNLSAIYARLNRLDESIALARKAQGIDPAQFATYINLSSALLAKGLVMDAMDQADRAIALAGDVGRCYFVRSRTYIAQRRWEDAFRDLQRSVDLDATQWVAYATMGDVAIELGKLPEAVQAYRISIRMKPDHLQAHTRLSFCLNRMGNRPEAIAAFEKARALAPNHPDIATLARELGL